MSKKTRNLKEYLDQNTLFQSEFENKEKEDVDIFHIKHRNPTADGINTFCRIRPINGKSGILFVF